MALLAAAALTAFGVLDRDDVDSIDWNILILMWAALSVAAEHSGLLAQMRRVDLGVLPGGIWSAGFVVAVTAVGLSTVMSNTATAALLVPTALALSLPGREQFAMLAALACSFGMALPVSTPAQRHRLRDRHDPVEDDVARRGAGLRRLPGPDATRLPARAAAGVLTTDSRGFTRLGLPGVPPVN